MTRKRTRNFYFLASTHLPLNATSNLAKDRSGHTCQKKHCHTLSLPCKPVGMFATSELLSCMPQTGVCLISSQRNSSTYADIWQQTIRIQMSEYLHPEIKYQHRSTPPTCPGTGRELPDQTQSRCLLHLLLSLIQTSIVFLILWQYFQVFKGVQEPR